MSSSLYYASYSKIYLLAKTTFIQHTFLKLKSLNLRLRKSIVLKYQWCCRQVHTYTIAAEEKLQCHCLQEYSDLIIVVLVLLLMCGTLVHDDNDDVHDEEIRRSDHDDTCSWVTTHQYHTLSLIWTMNTWTLFLLCPILLCIIKWGWGKMITHYDFIV